MPEPSSLLHPRDQWEWFGKSGHLIVGEDCRFHLCTLVGPWIVSTVGEWLPDEGSREITAEVRGVTLEGRGDARRADFMRKLGYQDIGAGRKYETMVFPFEKRCDNDECDCGCPLPGGWSEYDSDGYNDRRAAHEGHYAMCERWAQKPEGSPARWDEDDAE